MKNTRSDRFRLRRALLPGLVLSAVAISFGDGPGVIESRRVASDFALTADPVPAFNALAVIDLEAK